MWKLLKATVLSFIEDEALSRGAAIAFYTVTSLAPILLIVVAIAGLAFGQEAAQKAITAQLTGLMGTQTADVLQSALAGASSKSSGILATVIGIVTLLVTASGVFGEMQTALNKIWDAEPRSSTVTRLIWARAVSLGLVAALGFLAHPNTPDPALETRIQGLIPDIERYITSGMKSFDVPGLAIGIVANDKLVYGKGFAVCAKEGGGTVDTKTVFQIGSATKAFLGTTLAIMVHRSRFKWDDRVVDLYPDFQLKDPWVTREFRASISSPNARASRLMLTRCRQWSG